MDRRAERARYWLTRFLILRLLGLVYLVAFLVAARQNVSLIGHDGLMPADRYLARVATEAGSTVGAVSKLPTLFWIDASDRALLAVAWTGVALAAVVLAGYANALVLALLWALYLSIVHVGQDWYGFGWEIQLLETGFLAIFLCPLFDPRPFPRRPPPYVVIVLFRWLIFRIMLGAGLIKLRGDACWRDLTCLYYHYETQPIPNPLSRTLHFLPRWFHVGGVLYNHLAELVAPWFGFGPRLARHLAGGVMLAFQLILILSGNLSFLNWLTLVPILACFDDGLLARVLPARLVRAAERAQQAAQPSLAHASASIALAVVVAGLSVFPVKNMFFNRQQLMNYSFNRLHLVNTYGAFGSVGRERDEIVFEGTADAVPDEHATWKPYEFKCKPGDPLRRPCVISPYQLRLDWQIWFAAMGSWRQYPWTLHLVWKLLHNDAGAVALLDGNPFPDAPPRFIRAELYQYEFAPAGNPEGAWWRRTHLRPWLPPLSTDYPGLREYLTEQGW